MNKPKRITIKDIATELGVSLSTVNKALTGKSGIREKKRNEVIDVANRLGYKVNKVAQSLARKEMQIGIILPNDWPRFYDYMKKGLELELEQLSDYNIKGVFTYYSHKEKFEESLMESLDRLIDTGVSAIILSPAYNNYKEIMHKIEFKGIPLILLGSDITSYGKRLSCIRVNAELSGKMAAEIIRMLLPADKAVALFIGNKDIEVHHAKVLGFYEESNKINAITVAGVFETQDDSEFTYMLTKNLLEQRDDIGAIYVATGNSKAVCKCIEEHGFVGKVKVVATDIDKDQMKYMDKGIIVAIIHQNAELQGKLAIRTAYSYLSEGKLPIENILVTPQIALRNNIEQVLQDA